MNYQITLADRTASVDIQAHPKGGFWVTVDDGPRRHLTGEALGAAGFRLTEETAGGPRTKHISMAVVGEDVFAQVNGFGLSGTVVDPRNVRFDASSSGSADSVSTPMPGVVVRIPVQPGDHVSEGQVLVVVEAMKMENEFKSPRDGVVSLVSVEVGQALESNALLVSLETA